MMTPGSFGRLTVEQLHAYRNRQFLKEANKIFSISVGQKLSSNVPSLKLSTEQASLIDELYSRLCIRKVARICDLCRIDFDYSTNELKIVKQATKVHRNMGSAVKDGTTFLYPEEALFLLDSSAAEIYCNGCPMAFNEMLSKLTSIKLFSLGKYAVYATLFRSGYIVRRSSATHIETSTTNNQLSLLGGNHAHASTNQFYPKAYELSLHCRDILPSKWCFEEIFVPDDHGFKNIFLFNVKPSVLPFEYANNVPKFVWYRDFSRKFTKRNASDTSAVDEKRRSERNDFYKKRDCVQLNADCLSTWAEYKLKKKTFLYKRNHLKLKLLRLNGDGDRFHPIVHPSDLDPNTILERLSIVQGYEPVKEPVSDLEAFNPDFDVHLPKSGFKLSAPVRPTRCIIVKNVQDFCPVAERIGDFDSALTFAVVDNTDISYFAFQRGSVLSPLI